MINLNSTVLIANSIMGQSCLSVFSLVVGQSETEMNNKMQRTVKSMCVIFESSPG